MTYYLKPFSSHFHDILICFELFKDVSEQDLPDLSSHRFLNRYQETQNKHRTLLGWYVNSLYFTFSRKQILISYFLVFPLSAFLPYHEDLREKLGGSQKYVTAFVIQLDLNSYIRIEAPNFQSSPKFYRFTFNSFSEYKLIHFFQSLSFHKYRMVKFFKKAIPSS
jgi:hypothetical protein